MECNQPPPGRGVSVPPQYALLVVRGDLKGLGGVGLVARPSRIDITKKRTKKPRTRTKDDYMYLYFTMK